LTSGKLDRRVKLGPLRCRFFGRANKFSI
jgi:hypothetical protein